MPLRVSFTLSQQDLEQLHGAFRRALDTLATRDEQTVLDEARKLVGSVRAASVPDYVRERVDQLERIVMMLADPDWPLPHYVHPQAMAAVAYLVDPDDLIPDSVPVLGFLDDAIMIELIARELRHELTGYRNFCRYRDGRRERSADEILARRKQLRARVQERRARDEARGADKRGFRLW
jgi:uncharacterized membrane protein YkvA (DUF1232 family)